MPSLPLPVAPRPDGSRGDARRAEAQGNTPAVCRASYADSRVTEAYRESRGIVAAIKARDGSASGKRGRRSKRPPRPTTPGRAVCSPCPSPPPSERNSVRRWEIPGTEAGRPSLPVIGRRVAGRLQGRRTDLRSRSPAGRTASPVPRCECLVQDCGRSPEEPGSERSLRDARPDRTCCSSRIRCTAPG